MKRTVILFVTILFAVVTGCKKENEKPSIVQPDEGEFLAVIPNDVTDKLKDLNLGRDCVFWRSEDTISIMRNIGFGLRYIVKKGSNDNTLALFVEDKDFEYHCLEIENEIKVKSYSADDMNANIAIYPFQDYDYLRYVGNEIDRKSGNRVHKIHYVTLPQVQKYEKSGFAKGVLPMVAVTENPDLRILYFKNLLGFVKLPLRGNVAVKNIKLKSQGMPLSGIADIVCSSEKEPEIISLRYRNDGDVVLDEINVELNPKKTRDFWFAIPPGEYSSGFTVEIATEDGFLITRSINGPITIERSQATTLNELNIDDKGNELYIPDRYFRASLMECGVDTNQDGKITLEEVQKWNATDLIGSIYVTDAKSLEGIQFFSGLRTFTCYSYGLARGHLAPFDMSANKKLERLILSGLGIISFPSGVSDNVKTISLRNVKIKELDVSRYKLLDSLECYGDRYLTSLSLDNNTSLRYFNCEMSGLTTLDVSKTKIGDNGDKYPLRCFSLALKTLYLRSGWKIKGINVDRDKEYISPETLILYKD